MVADHLAPHLLPWLQLYSDIGLQREAKLLAEQAEQQGASGMAAAMLGRLSGAGGGMLGSLMGRVTSAQGGSSAGNGGGR